MKKVLLMCLALGLVAASQAALVDAFETYSTGLVNTVATPTWAELQTAGYSSVARINIDCPLDNAGNKFLTIKPDAAKTPNLLLDPTHAVYRGVTAIANSNTATTLFLRFRADVATTNSSFGASNLAVPVGYATGSFNDLNVQLRVNSAVIGGVTTPVFNVRNGGAFTANYALTQGQWYNVWAVIHQSTDKFDAYLTTGTNGADVVGNRLYSQVNMSFRVASATDLVTFLAMSQGSKALPNDNRLSLDQIFLTDGTVLSVPEPATMLVLGLGSLLLRKKK